GVAAIGSGGNYALSAARAGGVAFLTGQLPDQLATLVARFADGLGSSPPVVYDAQAALEGRAILSAANSAILGGAGVPYFDIAAADVVYAFESDFLATGLSPVAHNIAYGSMRSRPAGRGLMVSFEPRLSMTAASADRWVPIAPGTGGHVALALGRLLVAEGLVGNGAAPAFRRVFNGVDIEGIARLSGVDVDVLRRLAMHLGEARSAVAVPGGELGGHSNGLAAAKAVAALNGLLAEEAARPAAKSPPAVPQSRDLAGVPPGSYADVAALVDKMARGAVDALIIVGANPMYELPVALKFEAAMAKVPLVVSSAALMDDTARHADVVLPAATYLEAWGYEVVEPAVGGGAVGAQQPVVRIRDEARDVGDALLAMARAMGGDAARRMPWPNMVAFIQSRLTSLQSAGGNVTASDPGAFWAKWLQAGGWWRRAASAPRSSGDPAALRNLKVPEPQFDGPPGEYPLHLLPVASAAFGDGRHAGLPWLQELPDPTTSVTWSTWVELHPQTAGDLGVGDGDVVEVVSPHGSIQAAVYVYPGIRPDVVAVPVGQGHAGLGRWASGRGANVLAILSPKAVPGTGHHAWAGTRVRVVATGDRRPLARLESPVGVDRAQAEDRPIG
ncbi:MAG: molybdopterin dinucleotide binding domain-containing protein, partial [Anaerolineae bacterium]